MLLDQLKFKLEAQQHTIPSQAAPSPATSQLPPEPPLIPDQEKKKRTNRPEIDESRFTMSMEGKELSI